MVLEIFSGMGTVWSCNRKSATNFSIPHGIAVSIGMDMANYIAFSNGILPDKCRVENAFNII